MCHPMITLQQWHYFCILFYFVHLLQCIIEKTVNSKQSFCAWLSTHDGCRDNGASLVVYVDIGISRGFIFREMQNICKDPNLTVHLSIFIFPSDESVARITLIIDISYNLRISWLQFKCARFNRFLIKLL